MIAAHELKRVHSKHQTVMKQKQPDTHVHNNEK